MAFHRLSSSRCRFVVLASIDGVHDEHRQSVVRFWPGTCRQPFHRFCIWSWPRCLYTVGRRPAGTDQDCTACDSHLPTAILVGRVLGRLLRQFRRSSSRVPLCACPSELPAALRHVIGVTVSYYCGGSVAVDLSVCRQSRVPSVMYVLASVRHSLHPLRRPRWSLFHPLNVAPVCVTNSVIGWNRF